MPDVQALGNAMRSVKRVVDDVRLEAVRGRVMDAQVWSETHVRGSGSGVMVKGFGVGSSKTTSTVLNKREVCFETEDGLQIMEEFDAGTVTLMPGQEVTLIRARRRGVVEPTTVGIQNHSMRKPMLTGKDQFPDVRIWLVLSPFATILGVFILFAVSKASSPSAFWAVIGMALLLGNAYWLRGPEIIRTFERRVRDMMREAEDNRSAPPAASRVA